MTINSESPNDPFNYWREWHAVPQVRDSNEMLRCLSETLDLIDEAAEEFGDAADLVAVGDLRFSSDPAVLIPLHNELLRLLETLELAVSVTLVQVEAELVVDVNQVPDLALGHDKDLQAPDLQAPDLQVSVPAGRLDRKTIRIDSADRSYCCRGCHEFMQNGFLWQRALDMLSQDQNEMPPVISEGPCLSTDSENELVPSSLGIETNTIHVVFDGTRFRSVSEVLEPEKPVAERAVGDEGMAVQPDCQASQESQPQPTGDSGELRSPSPGLWGPHWVDRAERASDIEPDSPQSDSINQANSAGKQAFPQRVRRHRVLPENGGARSRRRSNEARCHCLRCNAIRETCRAPRLSSRSTAGCRDKRSCKVLDLKDDL